LKASLLVVLFVLASVSYGQQNGETQLTGTAINTTSPDNPVAAPIRIVVSHSGCKLTVSPPLTGSGDCTIKSFDKQSGHIEIVSLGPPLIVWSGTIKGNLASGTYKISVGAQTGSFYLAILKQPQPETPPARPQAPTPFVVPYRGSCTPAIESAINGEIQGWDGETIFKLQNGQIWQQAEYEYTYFYEYSPDVTIYETSAGCRMKVEDEDDTVLVKRIK
jgi:hypothetical protein